MYKLTFLMNLKYLPIAFLFVIQQLTAQYIVKNTDNTNFQYGIASKLNIELQPSMTSANFRLSVTLGAGYNVKNSFFPALHTGILIFNKGVIGSSFNDPSYKPRFHFFYTAQATARLDKRNYSYYKRYVPLYFFSNFSANPLHNPYKTAITYGAIWMYMQKKAKQRLGFFNFNVGGKAQISYYNDGGPVMKWVGDKHDRYYTGGVVISYHENNRFIFDMVELSYHKFTGYAKHAFDVADKLQMDYVVYADKSQFAFNHQQWKINVSNLSKGYSAHFSVYDYDIWDIQDIIHFNTNVPFHPDYFKNERIAFGGRYEHIYTAFKK